MQIAENIKRIRELKNYTQEHVAELLGISQTQYSNLETGHSKIDKDKIEKLAKAFDMKPADIVTFHEQNVFYQTFNNHKEAKSNNFIYHQNNNAPQTPSEMMQTMISKLDEIIVLLKK